MYKVKLLVGKEMLEVTIEAVLCLVDGNNNLVFQSQVSMPGEPVAIISASRWVSVEKI